MKGILLAVLLIFFLSEVSAYCNSTQVDINSANATELDKLSGIGSIYAQRIIDNRTYNSVDDLTKVKGIGPATLTKIKTQGLACVANEQNTFVIQDTPNITNEPTVITQTPAPLILGDNLVNNTNELPPINLSKNIKTQNGNEGNKKYAIYGFIGFCILLTVLFILKGKARKNEFR
jgi:competence ComEA-like helix-hairpin-helix protein